MLEDRETANSLYFPFVFTSASTDSKCLSLISTAACAARAVVIARADKYP